MGLIIRPDRTGGRWLTPGQAYLLERLPNKVLLSLKEMLSEVTVTRSCGRIDELENPVQSARSRSDTSWQ
jgi:hypothetical protein